MSRRAKESPGQGFLFDSVEETPKAPVPAPTPAEKKSPVEAPKSVPSAPVPVAPPTAAPQVTSALPKAAAAAAISELPKARTDAPKPAPRRTPAPVPVHPGAAEAPARELTSEQREAATLSSNRVLSASAGTGKTFTLTEIYLNLLAGAAMPGKTAPLHPSQIVAVTFTEKAAAELRDRVRREVDARLAVAADPTQLAHLRRCRDELPGAPVSTIHAFCARLLHEAGERPGVPAGFSVLEEEEAGDLLDRALNEAAAEALAGNTSSALRTLAREWGVAAGGDYGLVPVARSLIRTLRTRGLGPEVLAPDLVEQNHVARLEATLAEIFDAVRQVPDKGKYKPSRELREIADREPVVGGLESARKLVLQIYFHCAASSGNKLYKWAEDAGLDPLLREALSAAHAPYRAALAKYLEAGMAAFQREKLRQGALDFDDLLLEARRLLQEDPEVAHGYAFVLIDEFQDTNPLQKDVLYRVAFPPNGEPDSDDVKLAIVGDVKQSIYRFRGADVSVMAGACDVLDVKPLRRNFRSRRAVVDWINAFCARTLWPADTGGLVYGETHQLLPDDHEGRHAWDGPSGEILVRPEDEEKDAAPDARWQQALAIARRVRSLVAPAPQGELVRPSVWLRKEKQTRASVQYADIAILVRTLKHLRMPLELALGRMGIPFRMLGGVSFYTRPEVLDTVNLLAWTADPQDTSALLGLLRSPFVQLSDGAVFDLMQAEADAPSPLERLRAFAAKAPAAWNARDREALANGVGLLEALLARRGASTAANLIDMACKETGFLGILAMQPQGETAVAAVRRLIEQSRAFESRGAHTLGDFVEVLREKADAEWDDHGAEGGPDLTPDLPESLDAVQIGTIHSAKGLEFPIVILADIGFERPSSSGSALLGVAGVGLRLGCENEGMRARSDSIHETADERNKFEEEAESRRLLYVAITRACDYLVLCGEKRTRKGLWRSWIDAQEAAAPALVHVPYNHPELMAAKEDAGRALVGFEGERATVKPAPEAVPADAARLRTLLEGATLLPAAARRTRRAEISISEFARFLSCPRRHQLTELHAETLAADDLGREPGKLDESFGDTREAARKLGIAAHAALEAAFGTGRASAAAAAWQRALAEEDLQDSAASSRETWARVQAALAQPWAARVLALEASQRFAERPLRWQVDLGGSAGGSVVLTGTLDLLAGGERPGAWQVIDYKLTASADGKDAVQAESLRRYAWQVGLYALAVSKLLEAPPEAVEPALLFLKDKTPAPVPVSRLGLMPSPPARVGEGALKAALASYLEVSGGGAACKETWAVGAERSEPREASRCRAEGCPFVPLCFAR